MSDSFEKKLEKYAELVVKVGVNIQQGQTLAISASISAAYFVRKVCEYAYRYGAHHVHVDWVDEALSRIEYELMSEEALAEISPWKVKAYEEMAENGAAFLYILSPHLNDMKGIDPDRIDIAANASAQALSAFTERLTSMQVSWSVVTLPTEPWAKKVFPQWAPKEGLEQLWSAIFSATRVDVDDPIAEWAQHIDTLNKKATLLNDQHFRFLHYEGFGTNLVVELPENHLWVNGLGKNNRGVTFICNLPTEEIYTTPLKTGVNGVIRNTKPFVYDGKLVNDFTLTFEHGRIIDFSAKEGYEELKRIIDTDEGSKYIGEVALVPHSSPISASNLTFYHTLFDENASCHIAIGHAYTAGLKDGHIMTAEQKEASGINASIIHIDMMLGSEQLQINGERADGTVVPIFVQGNWTEHFNAKKGDV